MPTTYQILLAAVLLASLAASSPSSATITDVDHADDICAPTEDPCVLSEVAEVVSGTILDFGARAFRIAANGQLNTGAGGVTLMCGELIAEAGTTPAIKARGPAGGSIDGGILDIRVLRRCEADQGATCFTDLDCDLGPCAGQTCARSPSISCATDADCALGACSVGSGNASIYGNVRGQGLSAGSIDISAAGAMTVTGLIDAHGTTVDSDGGTIELRAAQGALTISGNIDATSGGDSEGGILEIDGGIDVIIDGSVSVDGGSFDGGLIEIDAGRDIFIDGDVSASAVSRDGGGGEIALSAVRDLRLGEPARLSANGHTATLEASGGDAGLIMIESGRHLTMQSASRIELDGGRPDGSGGILDIYAERDADLAGAITARSLGGFGFGGTVEVDGCSIDLEGSARIESSGEDGELVLTGSGRIVLAAGGVVAFDPTSTMTVEYGDAALPPLLLGSITPTPQIDLVALRACAQCDDDTEICDDGLSCTTNDTCVAGRCMGISVCAEGFVCSPTIDDCVPIGVTTTTLPGTCGDGIANGSEECDEAGEWTQGSYCSADCTMLACGDTNDDGGTTAADALFALNSAVGLRSCDACICDVDSSSSITAGDALRVLKAALALPVALGCPVCTPGG